MNLTHTLAEIAQLLGVTLPASAAAMSITGVNSLEAATAAEVTYLSSDQFLKQFATTRAAAVIVQKRVKLPPETSIPILIVDDAELAIAKVLALFAPPVPRPPAGVDAAARVAKTAIIEEGVAVGPFVFIGERCRIGRHTVLHPGVYIGDDVTLGESCEIFPNVAIRERITLGNRVIIHSGSAVGTDGFGYRWDGSKHAKVPQIGTIVIEDDVEIGSCVCIDRAKFSETRIGRGTKIDNLVQIAHNCQIGEHCIIAGQTGMAGSVKLGRGVILGGASALRDHITIGDGAMVAATSAVAEDIPPKTIVSGSPAMPHRQTLRENAAMRRLPELVVQVRKLQEQIDSIQASLTDKK
jgi:UDP-3-O-[3-hydroxymyristoyl] glucosamine N-acyltransferase